MNNEVKTINGYSIKDETARNNINLLSGKTDLKLEINKNINDITFINKKFKNVNIFTKYYNENLYYFIHIKDISDIRVLATSGDIESPITNAKNLLEYSKLSDYDILLNTSPFDSNHEPLGYQKSNNSSYIPSGSNENPSYLYYACFDNSNNLTIKKADTINSINDLNDYKNVCTGFQALVINGEEVQTSDSDKARRQVIAQLEDNSYLIISTGGRNFLTHGSSYDDLKDVLRNYEVSNAISVDGGGSTQTYLYKNSMITPSDIAEINGRIIPICIGFKVGDIND